MIHFEKFLEHKNFFLDIIHEAKPIFSKNVQIGESHWYSLS